jgi:hypothetical protein
VNDNTRRVGDYFHNKQADNQRYNQQNERNKNNNVPHNCRNYSPVPAPKNNEERGRDYFGKGNSPARKWYKKPAKLRPWGEHQLTPDQREQYLAEGRCYRCYKVGHVARQCPDGQKMEGNRSGPPGRRQGDSRQGSNGRSNAKAGPSNSMSISGVNFDLADLDKQNHLASTTQEIHSLELGSIGRLLPDTEDELMDFMLPRLPWPSGKEFSADFLLTPIGDLLAEYARELLTLAQPFPGDPMNPPPNGLWTRENRFQVYQVSDTHHMISDGWCTDELDAGYSYVPTSLLDGGDVVRYYHDIRISKELHCHGVDPACVNVLGGQNC